MPRYALKDVYVSSYSLGGSADGSTSDSFGFGANNGGSTGYTASDDLFKFKDMNNGGNGDSGHDDWIDVQSFDWGTSRGAHQSADYAPINYEGIDITYEPQTETGYVSEDELWI